MLKQKLIRCLSATEIWIINMYEILLHAEQCFLKPANACRHGYVPESRFETHRYDDKIQHELRDVKR